MSKLYGTLSGDGRAQEKTRRANTYVRATAQSWEGSVAAYIQRSQDTGEVHRFEFASGAGSTAYPPHTVASGTIANGVLSFDYVAPELVEWVLANHKAEQDGEVTK